MLEVKLYQKLSWLEFYKGPVEIQQGLFRLFTSHNFYVQYRILLTVNQNTFRFYEFRTLRDLHFLSKLNTHQSALFNFSYIGSWNVVLLSNLFSLLFKSKVEVKHCSGFTGELNIQLVNALQIELVQENDFHRKVSGTLCDFDLVDGFGGIIVDEEFIVHQNLNSYRAILRVYY